MKLGLKLWSTNTDYYFDEAKRLYNEGWFDYIELYIVPNTISTIDKWKSLDIPFTLHAPHFMHDVNLANKFKEKTNYQLFLEVKEFFKILNAKYVVVHLGIEGIIEETIRQLSAINLGEMLIENKPFIAPTADNLVCRGATIEEITKVMNELKCGFCLDIGHAICTANYLGINPYEFLNNFNTLTPTCYHLSDNYIDSQIDKHLHLGDGNYDFIKILNIIDTNINIAIETNKNSKSDLNDYILDNIFLKRIINE